MQMGAQVVPNICMHTTDAIHTQRGSMCLLGVVKQGRVEMVHGIQSPPGGQTPCVAQGQALPGTASAKGRSISSRAITRAGSPVRVCLMWQEMVGRLGALKGGDGIRIDGDLLGLVTMKWTSTGLIAVDECTMGIQHSSRVGEQPGLAHLVRVGHSCCSQFPWSSGG